MGSRGSSARRRKSKKETTPYLWFLTIAVLLGSCASPPPTAVEAAPQAERPPSSAPDSPIPQQPEIEDPPPQPDQASGLAERHRNLSAQAAELASENQFLNASMAELESTLADLREENEVLKSLIDDILLAQGVISQSGSASASELEAAEPKAAEPPQARAAPQIAPASQPAERAEPAAVVTGNSHGADTSGGDSSAAGAGEPAPGRGGADDGEAFAAEALMPVTPAGADDLETARDFRESFLRYASDEATGTVQYVDSRIDYEAEAVAYLSIQTKPRLSPVVLLHLRTTARSGSLGVQAAVLDTVGQQIRLDASNSTIIRRVFGGGVIEEVVAHLTPHLFDSLAATIRSGGSLSILGLAGSRRWELSGTERAAMANVLYAFQELGGALPN